MEKETTIPEAVISEMISYAYSHNLIIKNKDLNGAVHVPFTLFPSPVVRSFFEKIDFYQIAFNKLIDKMSRDTGFLQETLQQFAETDNFIKNYIAISEKASKFTHKQNIQLGIFRNDYMVDKLKKFIYQIEINTIASSMGSFSDALKKFHYHFLNKYPEYFGKYFTEKEVVNDRTKEKEIVRESQIPQKENVIDNIANSMIAAAKLFSPDGWKQTVVIFVTQDKERNEFDQRAIEEQLWEKAGLKVVRLTLKQVLNTCTQDANLNLVVNNKIVSLVYFRACYTENDFENEVIIIILFRIVGKQENYSNYAQR
jgi:hypothetical protein